MNQNIEVSIEKLSAPVEILPLDRRACSQLRRASIYTVAEIILAGRGKLTSARSIGVGTASRILGATASYLGIAETFLAGETADLEVEPIDVWDDPISVLHLPITTLHALGSAGVFRIKGLLKSRPNAYGTILGLGEQDILAIDQELRSYLARRARIHLRTASGRIMVAEPSLRESPPNRNLEVALQLLHIDERGWSFLESRAMKLLSLGKLGAAFGGLSSSTVRRIILQAHKGVRQKLSFLAAFLDHFEARSNVLRERAGEASPDLNALVLHLLPDPVNSGLIANERDVERMIFLVRTMVMHRQSWFSGEIERRWGTFVFLSCFVDPAVTANEQVRCLLEERKPRRIKQTYKELVYSVLARAGNPMHWTEIAREVESLGMRDPFHASEIPPCLNSNKELFVRVGPGTYALLEWGARTADYYHVIIASILKQENRPLPFDFILARVAEIRPVKRSTLWMSLAMHPRFYESIEKTYGLRSWLLERDNSPLPTPCSYIEDPKSRGRVERARARGLNLDKFTCEDRGNV